MRGLVVFLGVSAVLTSVAWAHQDRIFPIATSGAIAGIDSKFGPASIQIKKPANGEPTVTVRFGSKINKVHPCVARLFVLPTGQTMRALGSWWHRRSILPPYLVFELPERRGAKDMSFTGHKVMFDLSTADILEVRRVESTPSASRQPLIELSSLCTKAELATFKHRDLRSAQSKKRRGR